MDQSSLYIVIALLILFGVAGRSSNIVKQIVFWGGLHLLAYAMLRVAPYRWYYAPLIPGAILLAASGLYFLQQRMSMRGFRHSFAVVVLISIFPLVAHVSSILKIKQYLTAGGPPNAMLPVIDWKAYHDTGEWLAENTSIDATVGVAEVGQLGFFARRWMTDYLGLLQPDVSAMLRRSDLYSWLVAYVPDYLVFQRFRGAGLVLYNLYIENDPWFRANYHPTINFDDARYYAGPVTVFERIAAKSQTVDEQSADVDFGNLHLKSLALDSTGLPASGESIRIRLDWIVRGELPRNIHIAVKGLNISGQNPGYDGDYDTSNWVGEFSTWHGFVTLKGDTGKYDLLVSVGPKAGPFQDAVIGSISIAR